jgi:hypothetical protein
MDSHSRRHQSLGIYGLKLISLRDLSCLTFLAQGVCPWNYEWVIREILWKFMFIVRSDDDGDDRIATINLSESALRIYCKWKSNASIVRICRCRMRRVQWTLTIHVMDEISRRCNFRSDVFERFEWWTLWKVLVVVEVYVFNIRMK